MPVVEQNNHHLLIHMAKRMKTDQTVDDASDKNPSFPSKPSDVAKALSLAVNRRPDINEYRCNIRADIDSFPTISPPLSDSELSPKTSHKKKKKSKHEKNEDTTKSDAKKTDSVIIDKDVTSKTSSHSSSEHESAMDDS